MNEAEGKKPKMTREEYYNSPEFITLRFLRNMSHEIGMTCQNLGDVLNLVVNKHEGIGGWDKFNLYERQLQVVRLEADKLNQRASDLANFIETLTVERGNGTGSVGPR